MTSVTIVTSTGSFAWFKLGGNSLLRAAGIYINKLACNLNHSSIDLQKISMISDFRPVFAQFLQRILT